MDIYCDYAATAPLLPEAAKAMTEFQLELVGNPSSIHRSGQLARVQLERSRKIIADAIGAESKDVVFTSGATEANNTIINGLLSPGDHVITSSIEHPAVTKPLERLAQAGVTVTTIEPNATGEIDVNAVEAAITPATKLITIMAVNNETGVINDLAALGELANRRNILLHSDAVQHFGKLQLDVDALGIHFLSTSAHKLGGPKGIGMLYARSGHPFDPLMLGGHQENHHRGGTENLIGIIGFAKAVEVAISHQREELARQGNLRQHFLNELTNNGVEYIENGLGCSPSILNISFPGANGHSLVIKLDMEGICASYGSSCASGDASASHVLTAMAIDPDTARQSVRFSFGPGTTTDELTLVAAIIAKSVPTSLIRQTTGAIND